MGKKGKKTASEVSGATGGTVSSSNLSLVEQNYTALFNIYTF